MKFIKYFCSTYTGFCTVKQLLKATKLFRVELVQGGWTTLYGSAIETKGFLAFLSE
jgi:hypothetical protein